MVKRKCTFPSDGAAPHAAKYRRVDADNDGRVSKKAHRVHTDKPTRSADDDLSLEIDTAQRKVYDVLLERLQQARIPLDDTTIASLSFIWPGNRPDLWLKLLDHPLTMTDSELATIVELEDSTSQTSHPDLGDQIYYVRSFKLRVCDIRWIISKFTQEGRHAAQCIAWHNAIDFIRDEQHIVYVRYIGTSAVVSAHGRFSADALYRKTGLYARFCELLREHFPASFNACSVRTFSGASTPSFGYVNGTLFRLHADHTDIKEQALIALFNRDVLLNRQVGGFSVAYQPQQRDIMHFEALGTQLIGKLLPDPSYGYAPPDAKMKSHVETWMQDVANLSNAHPVELGTDRIPVSEAMKRAWADQATPCTFYGKTLAVFVGDYCPISAMKNPGSFWRQDCRAAKYLKDTMARLVAYEGGKSRWRPEDLNPMADKSMLPWVDYQYTTKRDSYRWESAELMRQYLEAVRPLIVPSFEKATSSILRQNFGALYSEHDFHPWVGVPSIQYYTDRGKIFNLGNSARYAEWPVDPEDCFIQIPSLHPGNDRYDYGSTEVRHFLDVTMWEVMLMLDCALDILKEGFVGPRSQLCTKILDSFNKRWTSSGNAAVFAEAKKDLVAWYAAKPAAGNYSSDLRTYKTHWNGSKVNINLQGIISVYWQKPDGAKVKVTMTGGSGTNVHPPKNATGIEAIRTIHL
jgi:hypothetical protein